MCFLFLQWHVVIEKSLNCDYYIDTSYTPTCWYLLHRPPSPRWCRRYCTWRYSSYQHVSVGGVGGCLYRTYFLHRPPCYYMLEDTSTPTCQCRRYHCASFDLFYLIITIFNIFQVLLFNCYLNLSMTCNNWDRLMFSWYIISSWID